jgi:hypothetical protein
MGFLEAKASARPRIMQLTTIRGINTPSCREMEKKYAFITSSTITTNVAITTIYEAILTFLGMRFLIEEMMTLEKKRTKVTQSPMPIPFSTAVVMARVGHKPSTSLKGGRTSQKPLKNS